MSTKQWKAYIAKCRSEIKNRSTRQPEQFVRGRVFEDIVKKDWESTLEGNKDERGNLNTEHPIPLSALRVKSKNQNKKGKAGRLDMFIDELGDFVSIVEIKSTDWDEIKPKNRRRLMSSHRRQVWKYIYKYIDMDKTDVCAGIIYPRAPLSDGLKEDIEEYHGSYALQVVWYFD